MDNLLDHQHFQHESIALQNIFPEEVWLIVLEKLDTDLEHVSNSSPYLRNLLFSKRTLFLFSKVWQILDKTADPTKYQWLDYEEERIYTKEWISIVFKMRSVCQTWCNVIDDFCQNHEEHYSVTLDDPSEIQDGKYSCTLFELSPSASDINYDKFVAHFKATHSNLDEIKRSPFITNSISINVTNDEFPNSAILQTSRFLHEFGHYIWHCHLYVKNNFPVRVHYWYWKISQILTLLPNLKSLKIQYQFSGEQEDYEALNRERGCDTGHLATLPHFPNLKFLYISNPPPLLYERILQSNSHISVLEFARNELNNEPINLFPVPLPNLVRLFLNIQSEAELEQLRYAEHTESIEFIHLDFNCNFIKWNQIFEVLQIKFSKTTTVVLRLPTAKLPKDNSELLKDCLTFRLNMSKVKQLKLYMETFSSLDFVLPMKESLEILYVVITTVKELSDWRGTNEVKVIEKRESVNFFMHWDNLLLSNIWSLLPKLKQINVETEFGKSTDNKQVRTWTRAQWRNKN